LTEKFANCSDELADSIFREKEVQTDPKRFFFDMQMKAARRSRLVTIYH
jgi:hypothetical protein